MTGEPRCAVGVPNVGLFGDPLLLVELAVAAEEHGWDGFSVWDHLRRLEASGIPRQRQCSRDATSAARTSMVDGSGTDRRYPGWVRAGGPPGNLDAVSVQMRPSVWHAATGTLR